MLSEAAECFGLIRGAWGIKALLHRRENEEGVRLGAEVEVICKRALNQEGSVHLHLEEVVLLFPYKGDAFELAQGVTLDLSGGLCGWLVRLSQHEVEDELLSPQDDALHDVEGQHTQAVQNVDALLKKWDIRLAII